MLAASSSTRPCLLVLLLSGMSPEGKGSTYVRRIVVRLEVVVNDGMVDMICPDQVLDGSGSLLGRFLDFVDLD